MKSENLKKSSLSKLERIREIFWRIFFTAFVSLALFMLLNAILVARPEASPFSKLSLLLTGISLLTSLTTLIGFLVTTALVYIKKEKNELHSESDIEKKELEVKKLKKETEGS